MRIKRLEIFGFKSFAEKTRLLFESGITAIVGPNGCGKSNIADAFRWVLGEQSARSMRGNKMNDVIFSGTSTKKPLNLAEVSFTLGDIDGKLPIDYEELTITRRLHRSGESDYFINNQPVRLKDIQSLFLDSGMGKDAYSIFEQGKIDQVIQYSPLERRYLFEEAAGILRFLQRKKEAVRKLEQTDVNVSRVKDIHLEVEKQILQLEEQADKARVFKENKALLDRLERSIFTLRFDQIEEKRTTLSHTCSLKENLLGQEQMDLEKLLVELKEGRELLAEEDRAMQFSREELFKTRADKELAAKDKITSEEKLKAIVESEKKSQAEIHQLLESRKSREEEQKAYSKRLSELQIQEEDLQKIIQGKKSIAAHTESELRELRSKQQSGQQGLMALVQKQSQSESSWKQEMLRLETSQEKLLQLEQRKALLVKAETEAKKSLDNKQVEMSELLESLETQKEIFAQGEKTLETLAQELRESHLERERIQKELAEVLARQKVLQKLKEEREGFSQGSKRLLKESEDPKSPLYRKIRGLYEFISPLKGYERAVASVMKPYMQTLVVETKEDYDLATEFAKENSLKDYSLFCLVNLKEIKVHSSNQLELLLTHVEDNSVARHFLAEVAVAPKKSRLFDLVPEEMSEISTLEGNVLDRRRVFFYSSLSEHNIFVREAELKTLVKKTQQLEQALCSQESLIKSLQVKKNQVQTERIESDKKIRQGEMKLVEISSFQQRLKHELEKNSQEGIQLEQERKKIIQNREALQINVNKLHDEYKKLSELVDLEKQTMTSLQAVLSKHSQSYEVLRTELSSADGSWQKIVEEIRKIQHALHVIEIKNTESLQQEKKWIKQIEEGRILLDQMKLKQEKYAKILDEVECNLSEVVSACSDYEQKILLRKTKVTQLEKKIEEKRKHIKKHEADGQQLKIQTSQLESQRSLIESELEERFSISIPDARRYVLLADGPLEEVEKKIKALRQEIVALGDVNMTSIEECEKHKVRFQFLNQQLDDLQVSKEELVQIIRQLDFESRELFCKTFEEIRTNFKKNFAILFAGGEADLQFTEHSDPLEAGIDIIAKPPGKQMRSIHLLSGGEKCLTALALLFAIFEVKPSPFCILDEIDAPLDDANVERFIHIVKQYTDRCQFILITHNKRTMTIADVLIGVSMEEKGVSKVLSLELVNQTEPVI